MENEPGQFLLSEGSDLGLSPLIWQGLVYLRLLSIFVDIDQWLNNYWGGRPGQTDWRMNLRNSAKITLNLENKESFFWFTNTSFPAHWMLPEDEADTFSFSLALGLQRDMGSY